MACHSIEQEEKVRAQIMCSANVQITWLFHKIFYSLKINTVIIFFKRRSSSTDLSFCLLCISISV